MSGVDCGVGRDGEGGRDRVFVHGPACGERTTAGDAKERRGASPCTLILYVADLCEQFTATQSTFVMAAGPVDLTINFISPVEVRSPFVARI